MVFRKNKRKQSLAAWSFSSDLSDQKLEINFVWSDDNWIEHFEERAKLAGWTEEQHMYQLKVNLEKNSFTGF